MKGLPLSFVALGMGGAVLGDVLHVRCGLAAAAALNPRDQEDSGLLLGANSLGCSDIGILITTLLQEHRALVQHCQQLFAPEVDKPVRQGVALTMPVTAMDWTSQLRCTPIGKAVPADSAPATAWKACSAVLATTLADISAQFQQISSDLPDEWRDPQLCFLPKPHKPPSTAADPLDSSDQPGRH